MVKFAVVGLGHIGKRHAEMIRRNSNSELVAVCDILPKAQVGCGDMPEPFYNSIDTLLASNLDIDVVNICTPNAFHAEYAVKALSASRSHSIHFQSFVFLMVFQANVCFLLQRTQPPIKALTDNQERIQSRRLR